MTKRYKIPKIYSENKVVLENRVILEKAQNMIEQSKTIEQLNTAKKFMDLFIKSVNNPLTSYVLKDLWLEKEKSLIL